MKAYGREHSAPTGRRLQSFHAANQARDRPVDRRSPRPDAGTGSVTRATEDVSSQTDAAPRRAGLRAFGLGLLADMPPPGAWVATPLAEPILHLRTASAAEIAEHWSGLDAIGWEGTIDGAPFVVERGRAGDHRFVHGELPDQRGAPVAGTRAIHHLSADAGVLRCAPADPAEQSWWRVVLDSALFTVALLRGYEALHAGAIATPDGAIAIAATTGGGKSTLLNELLNDGWALMTDDVLVLESRGEGAPLAHPGAPLMTVPASISPLPGCADRVRRRGALGRRSGTPGGDPAARAGRVEPWPGPGHVAAPGSRPAGRADRLAAALSARARARTHPLRNGGRDRRARPDLGAERRSERHARHACRHAAGGADRGSRGTVREPSDRRLRIVRMRHVQPLLGSRRRARRPRARAPIRP